MCIYFMLASIRSYSFTVAWKENNFNFLDKELFFGGTLLVPRLFKEN